MSESLISIDARRNGRAFASLTARGGGLPVGVILARLLIGQVLADEGIGAGALTVDEQCDRLDLLSFPAGDPGGQRLGSLCTLLGLGDLGAQMQHIRQSAVGQGKSCIGLDRLGELFFWAKMLFQQQVDTSNSRFVLKILYDLCRKAFSERTSYPRSRV